MNNQRYIEQGIELVETANIARSLQRMQRCAGNYLEAAQRRALYHAVCMTNSFNAEERKALREAIKLP